MRSSKKITETPDHATVHRRVRARALRASIQRCKTTLNLPFVEVTIWANRDATEARRELEAIVREHTRELVALSRTSTWVTSIRLVRVRRRRSRRARARASRPVSSAGDGDPEPAPPQITPELRDAIADRLLGYHEHNAARAAFFLRLLLECRGWQFVKGHVRHEDAIERVQR